MVCELSMMVSVRADEHPWDVIDVVNEAVVDANGMESADEVLLSICLRVFLGD